MSVKNALRVEILTHTHTHKNTHTETEPHTHTETRKLEVQNNGGRNAMNAACLLLSDRLWRRSNRSRRPLVASTFGALQGRSVEWPKRTTQVPAKQENAIFAVVEAAAHKKNGLCMRVAEEEFSLFIAAVRARSPFASLYAVDVLSLGLAVGQRQRMSGEKRRAESTPVCRAGKTNRDTFLVETY